MKYVVCISGHLRTYEYCLTSIYLQKLLSNADKIYIATWEYEDVIKFCDKTKKFDTCCYSYSGENKKDNIDKLKILYNTKNIEIFSYPSYNTEKYICHNSINFPTFESFLNMHYLLKQCNNMVDIDCDVVVRIRPDLFFTKPIEIQKGLMFPTAGFLNQQYSPTDTFFYGPKKEMNIVTNFFDKSDFYIPNSIIPNWHERLFLKYLNNENVNYSFQNDIRYQILRYDFLKDTLGFYDKYGNIEIVKINSLFNDNYINQLSCTEMNKKYGNNWKEMFQ